VSKRFVLTVAAGGCIIIFGALLLLNWEKVFGDYRPIQTAKAVFKLEVGSQDVADVNGENCRYRAAQRQRLRERCETLLEVV